MIPLDIEIPSRLAQKRVGEILGGKTMRISGAYIPEKITI
jgi:hypothetical protein